VRATSHPECHDCKFDYKALGRAIVMTANPKGDHREAVCMSAKNRKKKSNV